ncbi:hypothetical protein V6N12_042429 [Hibiscus sabdariffa]|uniref:Uncharacterized protein n=1 Tax=Hibiscus sabdariffa TaxID=183260 RepID=A0ABR2EER6_9ROSI
MLANLPRTRHVHLYLVEEEIPKQTKNELVNKHVSEDAFEQAETKFMFTKPSIELQVETFSEDVFEQRETEHYTEPQAEPQIEPQAEPQTKQQVQTVSEASMEPEHEPSRFDDTEPDDSEDSDYNGSSRTNSVTSSFDDTDFQSRMCLNIMLMLKWILRVILGHT